jgi:hypothetical protein
VVPLATTAAAKNWSIKYSLENGTTKDVANITFANAKVNISTNPVDERI